MNELSNALGGMDPAEVALGAGMIGVVATLMAVASLAWFFISALGYYKMFQKAGQRGWLAFVPVVRGYIRYKISWSVKAFVVYAAALVICQLFAESQSLLLSLLAIVGCVVLVVTDVKQNLRMAKAFGKTTLWGVLLFFFPFIVTLILGFGKAEYIGAPAEK